jgi:hypothetical protein
MRNTKIFKIISTTALATGVLVSSFTASAASMTMTPTPQTVGVGASFFVDIMATNLPDGTSGGALDISWTGDMMLDSTAIDAVWDVPFSGVVSTGPNSITALFVTSFLGVSGDQGIAQLNFTTGAGFTGSTISMGDSPVGGPWSAWDGVNAPYNFTNTYEGATINPVPVPAALWLFGSGLIGLVGVARRRI